MTEESPDGDTLATQMPEHVQRLFGNCTYKDIDLLLLGDNDWKYSPIFKYSHI